MNTIKHLLFQYIHEKDAEKAGIKLFHLIDTIKMLEGEELLRASYLIVREIRSAAFDRRNAYAGLPSHKPFFITTGHDADLMYIAASMFPRIEADPETLLDTIENLARSYYNVNSSPVYGLDHCVEIFQYCFKTFPCLQKTNGVAITLAVPQIDIGCTAEDCQEENGSVLLFLSSRDNAMIESFAYEAVSSLICKNTTDRAKELLMRTHSVDENALSDDQLLNLYTEAVHDGLSCFGPYSERSESAASIWHDYILKL